MLNDQIKIKEIFCSIQGESTFAGLVTTFVRLTGCPLRCGYCDTAYAFHGGNNMTIPEIVTQIKRHPASNVCITGGEPLAQASCKKLIKTVCDFGYTVSIETSGAIDIADIDARAIIVMDLKTPGSGEVSKNLMSNIDKLRPHDQVKFVICNRADFDWTREIISKFPSLRQQECLISPAFSDVDPKDLAEWLLEQPTNLRMQVQMHKTIWGDEPGR